MSRESASEAWEASLTNPGGPICLLVTWASCTTVFLLQTTDAPWDEVTAKGLRGAFCLSQWRPRPDSVPVEVPRSRVPGGAVDEWQREAARLA